MALIDLELATGRQIRSSSFHVESTYSGLLEGYPNSRMNDNILKRLPGQARQSLGRWPVRLIEPRRTIHEAEHRTPFGPLERLPACWVAASFSSTSIRENMHVSEAILIWFQDEPNPVPADNVLLRLRNVNWEAFAEDCEL